MHRRVAPDGKLHATEAASNGGEPGLEADAGAHADSRMARISASVLRPFCAARSFSARCVASGKFGRSRRRLQALHSTDIDDIDR
jgi:hypothetical protein